MPSERSAPDSADMPKPLSSQRKLSERRGKLGHPCAGRISLSSGPASKTKPSPALELHSSVVSMTQVKPNTDSSRKSGARGSDALTVGELQPRTGSARSVFVRMLDYGVTSAQGTRRTMEDQHTMLAEGIPFFGVYDGHGGTQCAEYLRDHLHRLILCHPEIRSNPEKAVRDGITEADRTFLARSEVETNESGSVCAVALIVGNTLVIGNVGDCEVVLCHGGKPVVLTVKHNLASNPSEQERVKGAGGKVFHNRVGHPKFNPSVVSLAVTRAIGDAGFKLAEYTDGKPSGVIAEADTCSTKLTDEDEFLVIGCDGLWDVMSYDEVLCFCKRRLHEEGKDAHTIAEELAQAALNKGSTDNVTAMFIHLLRRDGGGSTLVADTTIKQSKQSDSPPL